LRQLSHQTREAEPVGRPKSRAGASVPDLAPLVLREYARDAMKRLESGLIASCAWRVTLKVVQLSLFALAVVPQTTGAPVIGPPVNQASFFPPSLPQYGVARGAMFAVFGQDMGPTRLVIVDAFPLSANLAGTSVEVTVGGVVGDCLMVFTSAGQLAAILPSDTPLGEGTITVTFNEETSQPAPILVVSSAVGIFTQPQTGQGPGIFTDTSFEINTLTRTFTAGDAGIAWVTGLGARGRDDTPMPEDLKDLLDIRVLVGGVEARIIYAGPSGCCGGVDQIVFEIPASPQGCFVPVVITVGESISNFATMSVSGDGGTCSDKHGLLASEIDRLVTDGPRFLATGTVSATALDSVQAGAAAALESPLGVLQSGISFTSLSVGVRAEQLLLTTNAPFVPFVIPEGTCIASWEVIGVTVPPVGTLSASLAGQIDFLLENSSGQQWQRPLSADNFYRETSILGNSIRLGEGGQVTFTPQDGFGLDGFEDLGTVQSFSQQLDAVDFVDPETQSPYLNDAWQLNENWRLNIGSRYDENEGETDWLPLRDTQIELPEVRPRLGIAYELKGRIAKLNNIQTSFECLYPGDGRASLAVSDEVLRSMQEGPGDGSHSLAIFSAEPMRTEFESGTFVTYTGQSRLRFQTGIPSR